MTPDTKSKSGKPIRVVIVDDHRIFRQGIQLNLELHEDIDVIGQGGDGQKALDLARELKPDVMVIDVNLPLMNGIQVTRTLDSDGATTRIVIVTAYDDAEQVIHAMRAGAAAYCPKEIEPDQLVEVIRHIHQGHYVVNDQVFDREGMLEWVEKGVEAVADDYLLDMGEPYSALSPREMEILHHVTRGQSNKEIAQSLQISHQTVKNHMTAILRKLAVEDRTQAAVYALRRGWVRLQDTGDKFGSSDEDFS